MQRAVADAQHTNTGRARRLGALLAILAVLFALVPARPAAAAVSEGNVVVGAAAATAGDTVLVGAAEAAPQPPPPWHGRLDRMLKGNDVGLTVRLNGTTLYSRRGKKDRVPASNQKLLMTMALFDTVDPASRLRTRAMAEQVIDGVVTGDLWLVGSGDPSLAGGRAYASNLPYRATKVSRLARKIRDAGVTQITGSVRGDVAAFSRDWWAHGWRSYYPAQYAPLPSGLTFNGNVVKGRHIDDPEVRAARSLTRKLRALGVRVGGEPGTGTAPVEAQVVTRVVSVPLVRVVRHTNRSSSNFHAEMLGKYVASAHGDRAVTIAGGAAAVQEWAAGRGVTITAHDASGLSWANRASTQDIATLLDSAAVTPTVRSTLARPGTGTLERRLKGVRVRAKTGTLPRHSALSGYVYLQRRGEWASFSILCDGLSKSTAVALEDRVVKLLEARAR